eukprot:COSAG06_NODE_3625_length_5100_cov_4.844231_6_plen_299_part_01
MSIQVELEPPQQPPQPAKQPQPEPEPEPEYGQEAPTKRRGSSPMVAAPPPLGTMFSGVNAGKLLLSDEDEDGEADATLLLQPEPEPEPEPDLGLSLHEAAPRSPLVALAAELEGVVAESERGREALRAEKSRRQQRSARNADRGQRSPTLAQQVATLVEMRYEAEALLGGRSPQRRDSDLGSGSGSESEGSESEGDGRGDDGGAPDVETLADSIMDNPEAFGLIGSKMPQRDDPQFRRLITSMLASALAAAGPPPPPPPPPPPSAQLNAQAGQREAERLEREAVDRQHEAEERQHAAEE